MVHRSEFVLLRSGGTIEVPSVPPPPPPHQQQTHLPLTFSGEREMCNVLHEIHGVHHHHHHHHHNNNNNKDGQFVCPVPKFVAENEGTVGGAVVSVPVRNPTAVLHATTATAHQSFVIAERGLIRQHNSLPFTELQGLPQVNNNCTDNNNTLAWTSDLIQSVDAVRRCCIVCDNVPMADMFMKYNTDSHLRIQKLQTSALHVACTLQSGASWVKMLCANGAKVNEQNLEGQTPLHLVLLGDIRNQRKNMEDCVTTLLQFGADVNVEDREGDSPLLYLRILLKEGLYEEANSLAEVLLGHGADPNAVNRQGRTLLTYSVYHLDDSIALSRLLLNHGATVWSSCAAVGSSSKEDQSSFSWFLKSIIHLRRLENCSLTTRLLSQAMGEYPKRMHAHVLRTMFRHVRCFRVLGPVFLQLKLSMMRYWSQPHDLKYLCWRALRRSMGPKRITWATPQLGLPRPLQRYMLME